MSTAFNVIATLIAKPGQQAILGTSESLEVREVEAESYIS